MTSLAIAGVHHDADGKRSMVYVRWQDDPEKRLGLVVPFGCSMDNLKDEAEKAIMKLAAELASATVKFPWE